MAPPKKRSWWFRVLRAVGVLLALVMAGAGLAAYVLMKVETIELDPHLYELEGGGGNTLVLLSDEGVLVVDTKFGPPAGKLAREVARLTDKPVKMVIDTHCHIDHTHGNPKFPGAEFVAARKTRQYLLDGDTMFMAGGEGDKMVPTTLVDEVAKFSFGEDFVEVRYLGRGHTDGDVVVFLHKRSVLHTGDLYVNGYYPIIDAAHGGSFRELGPTLDRIIAIGARTVIPGHGPRSGTDGVKRFREYVGAVWEHVLAGVRAGKSRDEIERGFDGARFHLSIMPGLSSLSKNIARAHAEAVALVQAEKK